MQEKIDSILQILDKINVPSQDDGVVFTRLDRCRALAKLLTASHYRLAHNEGLARIYLHERFQAHRPLILISCHIDSIYDVYFHEWYGPTAWLGTFDNVICTAILADAMGKDLLPDNAIVSFTGNEEQNLRGVAASLQYLKSQGLWKNLEMVVVLDVTHLGFEKYFSTIENVFVEKKPLAHNMLRFSQQQELVQYLRNKLAGKQMGRHQVGPKQTLVRCNSVPDEAWEYDEFDLNCFSLCLPCHAHPENQRKSVDHWMHNDKGILVTTESVVQYGKILVQLCQAISQDLP